MNPQEQKLKIVVVYSTPGTGGTDGTGGTSATVVPSPPSGSEGMTREGAVETARRIAARLDLPAHIYRAGRGYQVACMNHADLDPSVQARVEAVALPSGRLFVAYNSGAWPA